MQKQRVIIGARFKVPDSEHNFEVLGFLSIDTGMLIVKDMVTNEKTTIKLEYIDDKGIWFPPESGFSEAKEEFLRIQPKDIDPINHPSHYTFGKFEVLDVLLDWFPTNPLLWQVVKYVSRAAHKENYLEDLKKAQFYLNREIEKAQNDLQR